MSAWAYLLLAGGLEVAWALGLKASDGLTRPVPATLTILGMLLSFALLAQALKTLPVGTGYVIWTGIGAVGTTLFGMAWFGESRSPARLACIGLILAGTLGLKLISAKET